MPDELMDIGIPENIEISNEFHHMQIKRKWFNFSFIFFTLFVIVWDGFLFNWYWMAFSSFNIMAIFFPLLHLSIGLGLTYYVVAGYLNKTFVDVDFDSLIIKHRPIPFWGNKNIRSKTLTQIYCKRDGPYGFLNRAYSYSVRAITNDRENIELLSGLDSSEQALFIEQEIEKFLGITDRPIKGELR